MCKNITSNYSTRFRKTLKFEYINSSRIPSLEKRFPGSFENDFNSRSKSTTSGNSSSDLSNEKLPSTDENTENQVFTKILIFNINNAFTLF